MMRSLDLQIPRQSPAKRPAGERRRDWDEIDGGFTLAQAMTEARRCVQCAHPPCALLGCPLSQRIPEWIRHIAEGRLREAWRIISLRNSLSETCGKLCPQETLCESRCVVGRVSQPVAIGKLEEFVSRTARRLGWPTAPEEAQAAAAPKAASSSGASARPRRRVAIVGSGPAGLAAAEELRLRGREVVVLDRRDRPGGLLAYGIPNFKFAKERIENLARRLAEKGIEFRGGIEVGRGAMTLDALLDHANPAGGFDAGLLAIGAESGRAAKLPGEDLKNIVQASEFLTKKRNEGLHRVCAVFGGGDTAMDCVRTAVRMGFHKVLCIYRRTESEMPGRIEDRERAREEGVEFRFLEAPARFLGREGRLAQVECLRMQLGEPDASGRRRPVAIPGSEFTIDADAAVLALGYEVDDALASAAGLRMKRGAVEVGEAHETSRKGVFAAGDVINGADLIVTAIRSGRSAARAIEKYLEEL